MKSMAVICLSIFMNLSFQNISVGCEFEEIQPKLMETTNGEGRLTLNFQGQSRKVWLSGDYELGYKRGFGDMKITDRKTNGECHIEVWGAKKYLISKDEKALLIIYTDASYVFADVYNTTSCQKISSGGDNGPEFKATANELVIFPDCYGTDARTGAIDCWSGSVFNFTDTCGLIRSDQKSLALTKEKIGVSFSKNAKILNPMTGNAKLMSEGK